MQGNLISIVFIVFLLLFLFVMIYGIPFNIKHSVGKNRKVIIKTNITAAGVLAVVLFVNILNFALYSGYRNKYDMDRGGIFENLEYVCTLEDYHVLYRTSFLGSGHYIAVPSDVADISPVTRMCGDVMVFYEKGRPLYTENNKRYIGDYSCVVSNSARAIFPDFFWLDFYFGTADFLICFLFNFIELIMVKLKIRKQQKLTEDNSNGI